MIKFFELHKHYFINNISINFSELGTPMALLKGKLHPDDTPFRLKLMLDDTLSKIVTESFIKEGDVKIKMTFDIFTVEKEEKKVKEAEK